MPGGALGSAADGAEAEAGGDQQGGDPAPAERLPRRAEGDEGDVGEAVADAAARAQVDHLDRAGAEAGDGYEHPGRGDRHRGADDPGDEDAEEDVAHLVGEPAIGVAPERVRGVRGSAWDQPQTSGIGIAAKAAVAAASAAAIPAGVVASSAALP